MAKCLNDWLSVLRVTGLITIFLTFVAYVIGICILSKRTQDIGKIVKGQNVSLKNNNNNYNNI